MKIKSQRDFWAGVMFVGTGVVFALAARHHPLGDSAEPGPGTITLLLSVVMVILGAIVGFKALTIEADDGDPIGAIAWRPLLAIVSAVVVFAATITRLGLAFAVPLVIVIASLSESRFVWRSVLVNGVVSTLLAWLVFIVGLKLTIPMWPVH